MALQTNTLARAFRYNSVSLPDPGPQYTLEQVRELFSATYPEIVNAAIEGPEEKNGELVYTFRRAVGTKGAPAPRSWYELIADVPQPFTSSAIHDHVRASGLLEVVRSWPGLQTTLYWMRALGLVARVSSNGANRAVQLRRTKTYFADSLPNIFKHGADYRVGASEISTREATT